MGRFWQQSSRIIPARLLSGPCVQSWRDPASSSLGERRVGGGLCVEFVGGGVWEEEVRWKIWHPFVKLKASCV